MKYFLLLLLIFFGSVYCYQMADGTLVSDTEQLEWIKNGRKGIGNDIRYFNTYSEEYIQDLELKLHIESTRMWRIKTVSFITGITSLVLLFLSSMHFQFKKDWAVVMAVQKNTGWHWILFGLGFILTSYFIHDYFSAGDLLGNNENIYTSIYFSITTLLLSPIFFLIAVIASRESLQIGLKINRWEYYFAFILFILSALTLIIIGLGILFTPDLGGNWG